MSRCAVIVPSLHLEFCIESYMKMAGINFPAIEVDHEVQLT